MARVWSWDSFRPRSKPVQVAWMRTSTWPRLTWRRTGCARRRRNSGRRAFGPPNAEAVLGTWHILSLRNDTANVLTLARRVMQLRPQDPAAPQFVQEALGVFDQALAQHPDDPWLLLNAAVCHARLAHWEAVETCCRRAARFAPKALPVPVLLANLYLRQGMTDQAAEVMESQLTSLPMSAAQESMGQIRWQQGRKWDALAAFERAQQLDPGSQGAYLQAGYVCRDLDRLDDAVTHFQKAVALAPHSLTARFALAETLSRSGKTQQAIDIYEQILTDYPKHLLVLNNLACAYADEGLEFNRAIELARRAVARSPQSNPMHDTLGWACFRAGRHEEAVAALKKAVELPPDRGIVRYHFGKVLLATGKHDEAVEAFRAALKLGLPAKEKSDAESILAAP